MVIVRSGLPATFHQRAWGKPEIASSEQSTQLRTRANDSVHRDLGEIPDGNMEPLGRRSRFNQNLAAVDAA
jgi:hypothetical protein